MRDCLKHLDAHLLPGIPAPHDRTEHDGGAWKFNRIRVIASWGGGWDHVSVSLQSRCPTWEEMAWIKDQFFGENETVMQLHPAKSEYVNNHPFCLHMWRPQNAMIPTPPSWMVGTKKGQDILVAL